MAELLDEALDARPTGLSTGVTDLDRLTGGIVPGALWLVHGPARVGRTMLAVQVARLAAQSGSGTLLLTGAEPARRIGQFLLSGLARVPVHHLASTTDPAEQDRIEVMRQQLLRLPLHMGSLRPHGLNSHLEAARDLSLVVVDDLDLWANSPSDALAGLVSLTAHGPAVLATVPSSIAHSLSARDLTAWTRACSVVVGLSRDDGGPRIGEIDLDVESHRDGPTSRVTAAFEGFWARIVDMAVA